MSTTVIIERPNISVGNTPSPTIEIEYPQVTLDIQSGGLVPLNVDVSLVAGVNLSALRAVTTDANGNAVLASNATLSDAVVVGITETAATAGNAVSVRTAGIVTDAFWSWTKGPVYLGTNGQLTQTAPTGGAIVVHVGRALTTTTLQIDIDTTIQTV
jgi:hypothetical protein